MMNDKNKEKRDAIINHAMPLLAATANCLTVSAEESPFHDLTKSQECMILGTLADLHEMGARLILSLIVKQNAGATSTQFERSQAAADVGEALLDIIRAAARFTAAMRHLLPDADERQHLLVSAEEKLDELSLALDDIPKLSIAHSEFSINTQARLGSITR